MPPKKGTGKRTQRPDDTTAWQVILERIEAHDRMTIEAVNSRSDALERKIDAELRESRERDSLLEAAIRSLRADLKSDVARVEAKVDKLVPLEERVTTLERRA